MLQHVTVADAVHPAVAEQPAVNEPAVTSSNLNKIHII